MQPRQDVPSFDWPCVKSIDQSGDEIPCDRIKKKSGWHVGREHSTYQSDLPNAREYFNDCTDLESEISNRHSISIGTGANSIEKGLTGRGYNGDEMGDRGSLVLVVCRGLLIHVRYFRRIFMCSPYIPKIPITKVQQGTSWLAYLLYPSFQPFPPTGVWTIRSPRIT
ncbi:hypothetical protein BDV25DRAFT_162378 [Aspergillus avenaceus]|uniref:Uncharacterized protein n=1 Tax=Aspergillus avenaceus TaxID=36643 RepID=A0A5N6TJE3_ASPAV|nr:hypothetical protein BDV25DRAFT_162378 [Aspergillus avenaceus]